MKRILILKEHHGNVYLNASTDEQLHAAALSVLEVWARDFADLEEEKAHYKQENYQELGMSIEEFRKLPSSEIKNRGMEAIAEHEAFIADIESHQRCRASMFDAIARRDGSKAWDILKRERKHFDDQFELVQVHDVHPWTQES